MKSKTMTVEFKRLQDLENDLLTLPKSKKPKLQPKSVVSFDSLGSFRSFMTIQKLEILTLIANANPKSVRTSEDAGSSYRPRPKRLPIARSGEIYRL